jgi:hypothetical protein
MREMEIEKRRSEDGETMLLIVHKSVAGDTNYEIPAKLLLLLSQELVTKADCLPTSGCGCLLTQ